MSRRCNASLPRSTLEQNIHGLTHCIVQRSNDATPNQLSLPGRTCLDALLPAHLSGQALEQGGLPAAWGAQQQRHGAWLQDAGHAINDAVLLGRLLAHGARDPVLRPKWQSSRLKPTPHPTIMHQQQLSG